MQMSIRGRVERLMEFADAWLFIEETDDAALRRVCEIHGWNYRDVYKYWRNTLECRPPNDIEVYITLESEFGRGTVDEYFEEYRRNKKAELQESDEPSDESDEV